VASLTSRAPRPGPSVDAPQPFLRLAPWALTLAACGLGLLSLVSASESAVGPYGLIQALPLGYFVSLLVLLTAFIMTWVNRETRYPQFIAEAIVLVLLLHGAPAIVESEPRFPAAWVIAGFTDYIAHTGHLLPIDARFSWPSLLTGGALLSRAGGLQSVITVLKWWPVFINLMYLPPLFLLAKQILRDHKKAMLVVWIFPFANWVGQDYYSPQAITYLLYLVFACVVLGPFAANRGTLLPRRKQRYTLADGRAHASPESQGRGRRLLGPFAANRGTLLPRREHRYTLADGRAHASPEGGGLARREVITLVVVMLLVCSAMATGHQLTPYFAFAMVAVLAIVGRTRLAVWPAVLFLLATGWVCYGAQTFWAGHFHEVFGGVGHLGGNVSAGLVNRLRGSPAHYRVLDIRLLMVGGTWVIALAGLFLGRKTSADRRAVAVLMFVPLLVLAGQPYGGEAGLRAYLFSLPGALCLVVLALTAGIARLRVIAVALLTALLIPGFLVARWGNELSEMVLPAEISGMRAVYAMAPPGSSLLPITNAVTWDFMDVGKYKYVSTKIPLFLSESTFDKGVSAVAALLKNPQGGYVVITYSQLMYAQQSFGVPDNWVQNIERHLVGSHLFRLVYRNSATSVYEYVGRP
jgi:hypothetical protein